MSIRIRAAAVVLAATLAIAGCGGKEPTGPRPLAGGWQPSDSGSAAEPSDAGGASDGGADAVAAPAVDVPAPDPKDFPGMDEHTEAGAQQAFRYYIAAWVWSNQTGNTDVMRQLRTDDCGNCAKFEDESSTRIERGALWSETTIQDVSSEAAETANYDFEVIYLFSASSHEELDVNTGERVQIPAVDYRAGGGMVWDSGAWKVGGWAMKWGEGVHR